jgi:hypothetical protein
MTANTTEEVFKRILVQVSGTKELKPRALQLGPNHFEIRIDKIQLVNNARWNKLLVFGKKWSAFQNSKGFIPEVLFVLFFK